VKQSALGLFGDMVVNCYLHVKPFAQEILTSTVQYIRLWEEASWLRLCNNAVWVCGELTSKMGSDMLPFVAPISERILPIFCHQYPREAPQMLAENCALTLGRLGNVAPAVMAKDLERYSEEWCLHVVRVRESQEKEDAFRGFLHTVQVNPNALAKCLPKFIEAICYYTNPQPELSEAFRSVLIAFRNMLGAQWEACVLNVHPNCRTILQQRYSV
jgi:transportin-1